MAPWCLATMLSTLFMTINAAAIKPTIRRIGILFDPHFGLITNQPPGTPVFPNLSHCRVDQGAIGPLRGIKGQAIFLVWSSKTFFKAL